MAWSLLIFGVGAVLAWLGRRGAASGSHPVCTQCGFDLYRLPLDTPRCPECGQDILADGGIRIGHRQPIGPLVAAGAALLVLGGGLSLFHLRQEWPQVNGAPFKTVSWLAADVVSADDRLRGRAAAELIARLRAGRLTVDQGDRLAGRLLPLQADPAVAWDTRWGDVVQAAREARRLSDRPWRQYLVQTMQVTARVRPRVRTDDPVPFALACRLRAGTDYAGLAPGRLSAEVTASVGPVSTALRLPPVTVERFAPPAEWLAFWMPPGPDGAWPHPPAPGRQVLTLQVRITLADAAGADGAVTQSIALPFELLARAESSVAVRNAPELTADMETAVRYRPPRDAVDGGIPLPPGGGIALGSLWISGPPAAAALRVTLRQDGREWPLARVLVRPNDALTVPLALHASAPSPQAGPADIVCESDPPIAIGSVDVVEVWGGQLRRPITLVGPAPR
jgi:hypothetical protein